MLHGVARPQRSLLASRCPLLPTPTATFTATPLPSVTATPGLGCAGDCNGDGAVTINELVTAVGLALDDRPPTGCPAIDVGGDGHVTIDELVRAVTNALGGCPTNALRDGARGG